MRIVGYKRNITLKVEELDSLLNESIADRLEKIYQSSFVDKDNDKEYSHTRLSNNKAFKNAYEYTSEMSYFDKFLTITASMAFQNAGFPLPKPKIKYQNVEPDALGWFETKSVIEADDILNSQICYARLDERHQLGCYRLVTSRWNSTHLVLLHELCHYLNYAIEGPYSIDNGYVNKDIARHVSDYAKKAYAEFVAESLALLFFSSHFTDKFKENILPEIVKELPEFYEGSHKQFAGHYAALKLHGYKSEYEKDKTLITPFNLTEKHITDLAKKSNDYYPLSNRLETIMYCKANYFANDKIHIILDKLICFINDCYDIMPNFKSIQNLELQ